MPFSEFLMIPFNISYWTTWGIFGRLINFILGGSRIDINLEVFNIPEWCNVYLPTDSITYFIPLKPNIKYTKEIVLAVSVNMDAPAYEEFSLMLEAKIYDRLVGPFGFITLLSPASKNVNFSLTPDYLALIDLYTPEGTDIETPPLIEKKFPIEVTNLGNGKTIVEFEVLEEPPGFNTYFDPVNLTLDIKEEKIINLMITAPSDFSGYETITIGYTPHFYYNYSIIGTTELKTILVFYSPP